MTTEERFEAIAERADGRSLSPERLGSALLDFCLNGRLPREASDINYVRTADPAAVAQEVLDIRECVLDLEEATYLVAGGDPDGPWLAIIDAARDGGTAEVDEQLRAGVQGFTNGANRSILSRIHGSYRGRHEVAAT